MSDKKIGSYELVDHGIEHSQYFQGCGTAFTSYEEVATGIGDNFAEALDDCLEMIAQVGFDVEGMEERILKDENLTSFPTEPSVASLTDDNEEQDEEYELYYHVSIRWNPQVEYRVIVGNIGTVYSGDSRTEADRVFKEYVQQSKLQIGRAGGESVHLLCRTVEMPETIQVLAHHFGENPVNGVE